MGVESAIAGTTMPDMGKSKGKSTKPKPDEPSGKQAGEAEDKAGPKKRIGVNFTTDWHSVIRKLAGKRKMPVLWYLIELAREDAEKQGVTDLPPPPWEEEAE